MKKIFAIIVLIFLLCGSVAWADAIPVPSPEQEIPEESIGIWKVPSLKTATPLYTNEHVDAQDVIDAEDSAVFGAYGAGAAILDHAGSKTGK